MSNTAMDYLNLWHQSGGDNDWILDRLKMARGQGTNEIIAMLGYAYYDPGFFGDPNWYDYGLVLDIINKVVYQNDQIYEGYVEQLGGSAEHFEVAINGFPSSCMVCAGVPLSLSVSQLTPSDSPLNNTSWNFTDGISFNNVSGTTVEYTPTKLGPQRLNVTARIGNTYATEIYSYEVLPCVKNVKATTTYEKANLSWDPVESATTYTVYSSHYPNINLDDWDTFRGEESVDTNSFTGSFPNDSTYYFVVTARVPSEISIFDKVSTPASNEISITVGAGIIDPSMPPNNVTAHTSNETIHLQ